MKRKREILFYYNTSTVPLNLFKYYKVTGLKVKYYPVFIKLNMH